MSIEGREFDWYAQDAAGQFAVFASAGVGVVPDSARTHFEAHDEVTDSIENAGLSSGSVWTEYADYGLYAYDWSWSKRAYVRLSVTNNEPHGEILAKLQAIKNLPRLTCEFLESEQINDV